MPDELDEPEPDGPDATRDEEPDEDPPELALEPLRGVADPDLLLADDEGVRDPEGVWTRDDSLGAGARDGSGALDPPEEPDDPPDEPEELDPAGRGIAWAYEAAGTASATARPKTKSERGLLSMTMHSFNAK